MGHAVPQQQPTVVLRSQFNELRALLAVALLAVVGLTVAVVILANDSDQAGSTSAARAIEAVADNDFSPAAGRPDWLLPKWTPEEGASPGAGAAAKDEAATAAAIGQSSNGTVTRGSKASEDGAPSFARPGSETEFHGSKASEDGTSSFARPGSETEFRGSKASEDGTSSFARPGSETDLPGRASALP
jgi:hypothetical protein